MKALSAFRFVRTVGTVLTGEALASAAELRMAGQSAADYQLPPGTAVNAAVARAWDTMLAAYREWHKALGKLPEGDPAIKVTREKWLLPLLYELGWGRLENVTGGLEVEPGLGEDTAQHFPISHRSSYPDAAKPTAWVPLHLLGAGVALDSKTPNVAARAPQSMVQDYLNRENHALWAILSNGRQLRLLRDASALTRQSYVEFDLDEIFANQLYADFRLLFLTAHASRFTPRLTATAKKQAADSDDEDEDDDEESPEARLDNCWLERWRIQAIDVGARARLNLQDGIAAALQHLGNGLLACPDNVTLREHLATADDADRDLHRALLRIAYRLIILFVAEDRGLLHTDDTPSAARERYAEYFSTARLRRLSTAHAGGRHTDLWEAQQIITDALAGEGLPELGLSGLGATLFSRDFLGILRGARLPNYAFLAAVKALSQIDDPRTGTPRAVDYLNLDSEEFGGMYEGLLAYTPRYHPDDHSFTLTVAVGDERKKSGSYYTPSELIDVVLSEAIDPLLAETISAPSQSDKEIALLNLNVVDPACGSGHFVVAAARRLGTALAEIRTGDTEPSPAAVRAATADVIERCLYGVDLNDLAIEITKAALWLEAFDARRPFPFLDAHFRVGNALLGTTPALLKNNIPDSAFAVLGDDDKEWTAKLKARNKTERQADADQLILDFGPEALNVEIGQFHQAAIEADSGITGNLDQLRARADAWRRLEDDPDLKAAKLVADAWCAAFVQPKTGSQTSGQGITHRTLRSLFDNPQNVPDSVVTLIKKLARQYRFFHWHLEFPGIFTAREGHEDPTTGWSGGFSCVIGNPPWDALQLEDKQFFGNLGHHEIENAGTAAIRKKMIQQLEESDPNLYRQYGDARRQSDGINHLVRSGRFPLTAMGRINTYGLFAETMRTIAGRLGTIGVITPTGLATDKATADFFSDTLTNNRLHAFYDFDNEAKIFADVHHSFRFAVTTMTGTGRTVGRTRFAFLTRHIADVASRRFELAAEEVLKLNPNTGTLPMFRTRTDAEITLGIYNRHPVLIRDADPDGNPWELSFARQFHMADDSGHFHQAEYFAGGEFNGWSYEHDKIEYLPLYEGKMLWHFDHRFSTYRDATPAQLKMQILPRISDEQHDDPWVEPLARHWVQRSAVVKKMGGNWDRSWLLGWRDVTRSGAERTFVPAVLPFSALGDKFIPAFPKDRSHGPLLQSAWSSMVFDYVSRQKISGISMKQFTVKQLACPSPDAFDQPTPWDCDSTPAEWIRPYVLELSYTSWRLKPYADDIGDDGPPFHWIPERRALLRAELDAGFIHLYGLQREEAEHVLDSFDVLRKYEERNFGEYRTLRLVLEAYDRMAKAIADGGTGWKPLADPLPGSGPRHVAQPRA